MDSSVSPKEEIWFLRVCHHISTGLYSCIHSQPGHQMQGIRQLHAPVDILPGNNAVTHWRRWLGGHQTRSWRLQQFERTWTHGGCPAYCVTDTIILAHWFSEVIPTAGLTAILDKLVETQLGRKFLTSHIQSRSSLVNNWTVLWETTIRLQTLAYFINNIVSEASKITNNLN